MKRNLVVRELINNPNRNAGKHSSAKQKALSTATMKELDMELVKHADELQHAKDLEDFGLFDASKQALKTK
jgi:hypothetical protein